MDTQSSLAYLHCFSGISGDMFLAALLHAGLDEELLIHELQLLKGIDFTIQSNKELRSGIGCMQVTVTSPSNQQFRHLHGICELLNNSDLSHTIISRASAIFTRLAEAEATVHQISLDKIHFHEVGAVDTLVDIVGVLIGLQHLGISKIVCSPLPMGHGFVQCAHGNLPLPAPAVCELVRNIPVYGVNQNKELITPTGAVLAVELADEFGEMPPMRVQKVAYGAGSHTLKDDQPNLLRLVLGQAINVEENHEVEVIETNLDDWNSEGFPYLCELLFDAGALDVSLSPLIMKKGRPGQLLRIIAPPTHALALKQIILSETTAIGLRFHREGRMTLPRESTLVSTPWGDIVAKKVQTPRGTVIYPEYEACRKIALKHDIPLSQVYSAVSTTNHHS
jgi:uncharacterized protein (TIGR00299 family) protein